MTVYKGLVRVETLAGKPTYVDVTNEVADIVSWSGIREGVVHCISCHTTCAVYSQEFDHDMTPAGDTFMQADLSDGLDRVFPEQRDWKTYRYPGLRHFEEVEGWPDAEAYLPGATAPCSGTATRTCAPCSWVAARPSRWPAAGSR